MSDKSTVHPLFFMNTSVTNGQNLTEYEVCMAVVDVIGSEHLTGVQKVGNLWRVYANTLESRVKLTVDGIDLRSQHISMSTSNPYSFAKSDEGRPIKITIYGVKMHYENESIEKHLKGLGVKLLKPVENCKVKDGRGNNTEFINGDRVTFAEPEHTKAHPLNQWMLIGDCVAKVKHFGQHPKAEVCTKCFSKDHPVWRCYYGQACRVCRSQGHTEGTEACPHYVKESNIQVFGGKRDILSNFHPCNFVFDKVTYATREQCIQHQKAVHSDERKVAAQIMKSDDPSVAKQLSKCIQKSNHWNQYELSIYEDICYQAAKQNDQYHDELIDTNEYTLVEGVRDAYYWGSGLTKTATMRTQPDKLPGENHMGKIHMKVRERLLAERSRAEDGFIEPKQSTPRKYGTEDNEIYIDNRFDVLCKDAKVKEAILEEADIDEIQDDEDTASSSMNFGRGIGRGRATPMKRDRESSGSTPGKHPPHKTSRTSDSPQSKKEKKKKASETSSQQQKLTDLWNGETDKDKVTQFLDADEDNKKNQACGDHDPGGTGDDIKTDDW